MKQFKFLWIFLLSITALLSGCEQLKDLAEDEDTTENSKYGSEATKAPGVDYSRTRFPFDVGNKTGFIDINGNIVIEAIFPNNSRFVNGILNSNFVYYDESGKRILLEKYSYYYASDFNSEGYAIVQETYGTKLSLINKKGEVQFVNDKYKVLDNAAEGMLRGASSAEGGILDYKGNKIIDAQTTYYDMKSEYNEGYASFDVYTDDTHTTAKLERCFMDKTGKKFHSGKNFSYTNYSPTFVNGLVLVNMGGGKQFVDVAGNVAIAEAFSEAKPHYEGLAAVKKIENGFPNWGFIDKTGTWVITPTYSNIKDGFAEGLAAVATVINNDHTWGFVDKTGKVVIDYQYSYVENFSGGLAKVTTKTATKTTQSYIDRTGKVVWPKATTK